MSDLSQPLPQSSVRPALIGWISALAAVAIWALWVVGTRHAVTHALPPAAVGLLRFGVPALLLAPVIGRIGLFPKGLTLPRALGLFGAGAPFFLIVAMGMQFAPAAEIGPLLPGTMPLFVAMIGWLVFGERLKRVRVIGFMLILVGILCIGGYGLLFAGNGAWRGYVLLLTGACLWGIYTHAYRHSGLSALQAVAFIGFWSFLILIPFGAPSFFAAFGNGLAGPIVMQALLQGFRHRALWDRRRPARCLSRGGALAPVHRACSAHRYSDAGRNPQYGCCDRNRSGDAGRCAGERGSQSAVTEQESLRATREMRSTGAPMFFFFSNRIGCAGSLLISVGLTLLILFLMDVF
jgi:drug/metabolite transporter (DMT)-like permease